MKTVTGYLLTATAFIACPCHLILLLPLAIGLLGGTALGAALAANTGWVIAAATVYFVVALGAGLYLLKRRPRGTEDGPAALPDPKRATAKTPPAAGGGAGRSSHEAGVRR
jgi:mercuric ion transport protein